MEFLLVVVMIISGIAVAIGVLIGFGIAERQRAERDREAGSGLSASELTMSILTTIGRLGGAADAEISREIGSVELPNKVETDVSSWADAFRRCSMPGQRRLLLERAVRLAVALNPVVPLHQYQALLDLSFGLGFKTDALARLRARYRFEYIDHAKSGRPREAERGGGKPLFVRREIDRASRLLTLGIAGEPTRRELISRYRKLAAEVHPDRFHGTDPETQRKASSRFIAITEAYEDLLPWCPGD